MGLRRMGLRAGLLSSVLLVAGCVTLPQQQGTNPTTTGQSDPATETTENETAVRKLVKEGQEALIEKDLERASHLFNAALKLDITNPDLQFFNGLTYHLMGVQGDSTKFDLAEQGLSQALQYNPAHIAARYQLGLLYMDQRRYTAAQGHFAAVALRRDDDPRVLYDLALASYYAYDPRTAEAALNRLSQIDPESATRPEILRAQAIVKAALNDTEAANGYLKAYGATQEGSAKLKGLTRRVNSWHAYWDSDSGIQLAQFTAPGTATNDYSGNMGGMGTDNSFASGSTFDNGTGLNGPSSAQNAEAEMVVVDVVLIGTQEDTREARGVNLLNGLQMQFGNPLLGTPGFSWGTNRVDDQYHSGLDTNTRTITRQITIPAVTYSLNIANSADAQNEVLAKPSLVAQSGETSEFFSGTEILAAAVSGGDGDSVSVQKEVGVKLAVTPDVIDNETVRLHVVAERTFLTDPSNSVVFEFRLDTTKTNVNSTVTMRYGETLILGGLVEREKSNSDDGVPFVKDVPGLNLFFSEKTHRDYERSILILLTPRRPQYTTRSPESRQRVEENMSGFEHDLERLQKRHGDWYTPRPTFDDIIDTLKDRNFFEEFHAGDIKPAAWQGKIGEMEHIAAVRDRLLEG